MTLNDSAVDGCNDPRLSIIGNSARWPYMIEGARRVHMVLVALVVGSWVIGHEMVKMASMQARRTKDVELSRKRQSARHCLADVGKGWHDCQCDE